MIIFLLAQNFFNNLNNYVDLYMKKYNKFIKAGEYYDKLHQNIYKIIKNAKEFLDKRLEEKKTLFKVLNQKDYDEWKKSQNDNNNSNFYEDVTNDFLVLIKIDFLI